MLLAVGLPESSPVVVEKVAQLGLEEIENVSDAPVEPPDTVGVKL
jgi:hypothetical protein